MDSWGDMNTSEKAGLITAVFGGITSMVGNYYAAKTVQYQAKSQQLGYRFASDMAAINASSAEKDAQSILEAGKSQIAQYTMDAGQRKEAAKTTMAARGVVLGQGSTRDVEASMDIVKEIDRLTINANAVRAAEAERRRGQDYRNQAAMSGVSANNARISGQSVSPWLAAETSLLNSATSIASQWSYNKRKREE